MILVTGGAGYIGSHCVLSLLNKGCDVLVFDNLSTGHIETLNTLKKYGNLTFVKGDLQNKKEIFSLLHKYPVDAVIHFAAFSQVGESIENPDKYYQNNVIGTLNLLNSMIENNVKKIIFSSTASVYGEPKYIPIDETHPLCPINPYGRTKLIIEKIMDDYDSAYGLKSVRLRYFNVTGANEDTLTGERHNPETHLIPNILKSAFDDKKTFEIYGDDYDTKDGTCIRDYIDIEDLIDAHLLALEYLNKSGKTNVFNLGTKNGYSVKEVFDMCKEITGKNISVKIMPRREGDPSSLIADSTKAAEILGWLPKKDLKTSITNAYKWEYKLQKS